METYTRDDGRIAYRLSAHRSAVGWMLAMDDERAADLQDDG